MEFIGISFSLAIMAVSSIGESSPLLGDLKLDFEEFPTWALGILNPTVVTISSYIVSAGVHKWLESCSAAMQTLDPLTFDSAVTEACLGSLACLQHIKEALKREPGFYLALSVWIVLGVITEFYLPFVLFKPTSSITFYLCLDAGYTIWHCINMSGSPFPYVINAMLVAGIVMMILRRCLPRQTRIAAISEPCRSSDVMEDIHVPGSCATESRLPSLLVGLGVGYWAAALLTFLALSWPGGGENDTPMILSVVSCVCLPSFALVGLSMVADTYVFGVRFGEFIKSSVNMLLDRRRVAYWVMIAVFRDTFGLWISATIFVVTLF